MYDHLSDKELKPNKLTQNKHANKLCTYVAYMNRPSLLLTVVMTSTDFAPHVHLVTFAL